MDYKVGADENGGHGHMEFGSIGSAVVQVFYADDNERCEKSDDFANGLIDTMKDFEK